MSGLLAPGEILQLFIDRSNVEGLSTKIPVARHTQCMRGTGVARKNVTEQESEPPQTPVKIEGIPNFSQIIPDRGCTIQATTVLILPRKPCWSRGTTGDSERDTKRPLEFLERTIRIHAEVPDDLLIRPLGGTTNQQRACSGRLISAETDASCLEIDDRRHLTVAVQTMQRARHDPSLMRFRKR